MEISAKTQKFTTKWIEASDFCEVRRGSEGTSLEVSRTTHWPFRPQRKIDPASALVLDLPRLQSRAESVSRFALRFILSARSSGQGCYLLGVSALQRPDGSFLRSTSWRILLLNSIGFGSTTAKSRVATKWNHPLSTSIVHLTASSLLVTDSRDYLAWRCGLGAPRPFVSSWRCLGFLPS